MTTVIFRLVVALLLPCGLAQAHDPGLSNAQLQISRDTVTVRLHVDAGAHSTAATEMPANPIRITIDGNELPLLAESRRGGGHFEARFRRTPGRQLRVEVRLFEALGAGHKHFLKIDVPAPGEPVETLLSAREPFANVVLPDH